MDIYRCRGSGVGQGEGVGGGEGGREFIVEVVNNQKADQSDLNPPPPNDQSAGIGKYLLNRQGVYLSWGGGGP